MREEASSAAAHTAIKWDCSVDICPADIDVLCCPREWTPIGWDGKWGKSVGFVPPPPRLTSFRNHWGEWRGSTNRQASHSPCQQLFTSYKLLPQRRSQSLHSSATHDPLLCRDQGAFCPHFVTSGVLVREKPAAPPPQVYLCNKGLNLDASWAVYGACNPRW